MNTFHKEIINGSGTPGFSITLQPRIFELLHDLKCWTDAHADCSMKAWTEYQNILKELYELLKAFEPKDWKKDAYGRKETGLGVLSQPQRDQ